jgi:hypothetical protein
VTSSGNTTSSWGTQFLIYPSNFYGFTNFSALPYGFTAWNDTPVFSEQGLPTRFT